MRGGPALSSALRNGIQHRTARGDRGDRRSGDHHQATRLVERLRRAGYGRARHSGAERQPVGTLVRQVLTGRIVVPGGRAPGWATMALLFAADRIDDVESEIEPFVSQGGVVVSDRYDVERVVSSSRRRKRRRRRRPSRKRRLLLRHH